MYEQDQLNMMDLGSEQPKGDDIYQSEFYF